MKIRNILLAGLAAFGVCAFQSCLKDQEDVFDQPASARLDALLEKTMSVLKSPEQGWVLEYYPHTDRIYGGYIYTVKFTDAEVTAGFELAPGQFETSRYKLTNDNGAVLSFDTNNALLHYFSTPSSGAYEAFGGDFEFNILKAEKDEVILKGKRSGNLCKMYPLAKPAEEYLNGVVAMSERFDIVNVESVITGGVVVGEFDLGSRQFYIARDGASNDEVIDMAYLYTEDGIKLYEPLVFQGVTLEYLSFAEDGASVFDDNVTFTLALPAGFELLDKLAGDYKLAYRSGSFDVSIEKTAKGQLYLKGLHPTDIRLAFSIDASANTVKLTIHPQKVGSDGSYDFWICVWDTTAGYVTWGENYGLEAKVNLSGPSVPAFTLTDNGMWGSYVADGLIGWKMSPGTTTSQGNASGYSDFYFKNGSYQLAGPLTFTKQ